MNHPSTLVIDLAELTTADLYRVGGKAVALGRLARSGVLEAVKKKQIKDTP
jgi:hypothetical protein